MARIVLNPAALSETAAFLESAAGEYQVIGTQAAGCDCGCMPADVAGVVDAVTAGVRSQLGGIAEELSGQASDLSARAGVDQTGAYSGTTMLVGGSDASMYDNSGGGYNLVIGGTDPGLVQAGGGYNLMIGGTDPGLVQAGGGYSLVIDGSDQGLGQAGGGYSLNVGGSDLFFPETGGGYSLNIPGTHDDLSVPLGPTGDQFWDDPAGWLAGMQPASRALNASGFMGGISPVSWANALGHLGMIGEIQTYPGSGELYWNDFEGGAYVRQPGEEIGTRL